tara:strand:- start:14221 stop:14691 length:471 start_codon:yes stop_codon:yes gene_type:complete
MAENILGYKREKTQDQMRLISSDHATLKMGGKDQIHLVQNARVQFQHQVTPRFEAGSAELYWLTGQSQGSVTIGRAVSKSGFFSNLDTKKAATGDLITFTLDTVKGTHGIGVAASPKETLTFKNGVIAGLGANIATQGLDVSEEVTISFADLIAGE